MSKGEQTSLEKGLALLQELAASEAPLGVSELAQATDMNRTTAYRLCEVLERAGWLQSMTDGAPGRGSRKVDLGPRAFGLAVLATSKYGPESRLQPLMDALAQKVGETVHAAVLDGITVVHVARAVPASGPHMAVRLGERVPAHVSALGKAMLATLPRDAVLRRFPSEELPVSTAASISSRSQLLEALDEVAACGFAIDAEEARDGVACVGAPVFGREAVGMFAISVTSMPVRLQGERLDVVAREVYETARVATSALGGSAPLGWGHPRGDS
jgi:IclR family acetate operon transcriptional repressor